MRVVVQRVSSASVTIANERYGIIEEGFVVLLGIEHEDSQDDADWLVKKICALRVFGDEEGKMNLSLLDTGGGCLVVSQFTLHASTKKGNRPSFIRAARPDHAIPLYNYFINSLRTSGITRVEQGEFGAMMEVELINDGPVTIIIDSKSRE